MTLDPKQVAELLTNAGAFGVPSVAAVYYLVAYAQKVELIISKKVAFLLPGAAFSVIVPLAVFAPLWAAILLLILGAWVAVLLFKSGAKDNERTRTTPTNQGASQ